MKYSMLTRPVVNGFMNLFIFAVGLLLAMRVVVQFFVGTSGNSFVEWVYRVSGTLLEPFRWFWQNPKQVEGRWEVDFPALLALVIYPAAAYLIMSLVAWAPRRRGESKR